MGYLETLKHAGLSSPFAKGSVERAAAYVEGELGRGIC
ncbi:MAG: M3 family oligoendopeptidase [Dorea sp.]|nr:M3 family oligoendopeptidase [Dorea sp.]